jgi:hypothetical protein
MPATASTALCEGNFDSKVEGGWYGVHNAGAILQATAHL